MAPRYNIRLTSLLGRYVLYTAAPRHGYRGWPLPATPGTQSPPCLLVVRGAALKSGSSLSLGCIPAFCRNHLTPGAPEVEALESGSDRRPGKRGRGSTRHRVPPYVVLNELLGLQYVVEDLVCRKPRFPLPPAAAACRPTRGRVRRTPVQNTRGSPSLPLTCPPTRNRRAPPCGGAPLSALFVVVHVEDGSERMALLLARQSQLSVSRSY